MLVIWLSSILSENSSRALCSFYPENKFLKIRKESMFIMFNFKSFSEKHITELKYMHLKFVKKK